MNIRTIVETVISIIISNILMAFSVVAFISPNGFIMGGTTGIGLVITHYSTLPLSTVVLLVNIALFLIGFFFLGKKFALSTIGGTILYPLFMSVFEGIPDISNLTDDAMLAAILGGVLMGSGVGLMLRVGGSTGGTDILALILNKYTHLNLSVILYMVDGVILLLQISFSDPEQVLFGILILASITMVMNRVMLMGSMKVQIFAVSEKHEEIRKWILSEGDAGATLFSIKRGYTEKEELGIMCVIPR